MFELRPIADTEVDAFRDCMMSAFGGDLQDDPGGSDRIRALLPLDRAWAAFDQGAVVATLACFTMTLGIPGGTIPIAGLTMNSVRTTHRRRGLMRDLFRLQHEDARRRGEPVTGLWSASEATLYGRLGYGVAAESDALEVDTRGLMIAQRRDTRHDEEVCSGIDEATARAQLPEIYARVIADRPGAFHRDEVWWRERRFLESGLLRAGASRRRYVVARRGGVTVGYVVYRQRPGFQNGALSGTIEIGELIATDAAAEASLWRFVFAIDLFPTVKWTNAPIDTPLPWMVSDRRRITRRRSDTLWLRVDDVAAALAARSYQADGALRFAVGEATWELVVEGGHGRCTQTDAEPELRFELTALGSVLLGGVPVAVLARAGEITGPRDVVARANRLFTWPIVSWCSET